MPIIKDEVSQFLNPILVISHVGYRIPFMPCIKVTPSRITIPHPHYNFTKAQ
jgi:hypothetical protein